MNQKWEMASAPILRTPLLRWLRRSPKMRLLILMVCSCTLGGMLGLALHALAR